MYFAWNRIVAETTTGCLLEGGSCGKKGIPSGEVAKQAVKSLFEDLEHEACVDTHIQDQVCVRAFIWNYFGNRDKIRTFKLIIFMGLASGTSRIKTGPLSLHTKTAIFIMEQMTHVRSVRDIQDFSVAFNLASIQGQV